MRRLLVLFSICSFLLAQPLPTAAEDDSGAYLGVFGGGVFPVDMQLRDTKGPIVHLNDLDLENGLMVGAKIGTWLTENKALAVEAEVNYMTGVDSDRQPAYTSSGTDVRVSGDISLLSLFANFLLRYPQGLFHPYIGAGIGWTWFNFDDVTESANLGGFSVGSGPLEDDDSSPAFQALAGLEVDVAEKTALALGLRYFHTEPELDVLGVNVVFRAVVATLGIHYRF